MAGLATAQLSRERFQTADLSLRVVFHLTAITPRKDAVLQARLCGILKP
jgi:hypothetical protein